MLYRNYLVIPFARSDQTTNGWIGTADISWGDHEHRGLHTITGPSDQFTDRYAAEFYILTAAREWIDRRSRTVPAPALRELGSTIQDAVSPPVYKSDNLA
jgi:hypothetical protein